jgi:LPS export ABC transporter protein LptC
MLRFIHRLIYTFALLLLLQSCINDMPAVDLVISEKDRPAVTMNDVDIMYSDSAKVKMKLSGAKMDRYEGEKPHIVFPNGVDILFYDDSMKLTSQLKADYGIRYESTEEMEAKKNVEVVNVKGEKLNTEHLFWDGQKDRIYTNEFVKITTGDEVIYGDGLESNRDFTKWRIKNIKGSFNLKDQDTLGRAMQNK